MVTSSRGKTLPSPPWDRGSASFASRYTRAEALASSGGCTLKGIQSRTWPCSTSASSPMLPIAKVDKTPRETCLVCQGRIDSAQDPQPLTRPIVHIVADSSSAQKALHHRHSTAPIVSAVAALSRAEPAADAPQTFHNEEAGDIVSWLTRNTAAKGGKCIIASAYTVYNVMAASRPDLVRALARSDWPFAL